jgi:hypothetical protein
MKSFEIQLYRDGNWKTDSIYDDRGLAEMEARRMEHSPRYRNIRIVEEIYNENTEVTSLRTIYRDKRFQEKITQKTKSALEKRDSKPRKNNREREMKRRRRPEPKPKNNFSKIAINLGLIGLLGIAGLVALQYFSALNQ